MSKVWTVEAEVPPGVKLSYYCSPGTILPFLLTCDSNSRVYYACNYFLRAVANLDAGFEDHAASWIWKDLAELVDIKPVAGTLKVISLSDEEPVAIEFVNAIDIPEALECCYGDGI